MAAWRIDARTAKSTSAWQNALPQWLGQKDGRDAPQNGKGRLDALLQPKQHGSFAGLMAKTGSNMDSMVAGPCNA
eukprot:11179218-Lingulodinium_polyedra.AAC.1